MDCYIIRLPKKADVVLLEDSEMRILWFQERIPGLMVCRNVEEFKKHFEGNPSAFFLFWDHDLGPGENGADAAKWFAEKYKMTNRFHCIHSYNRAGAQRIQSYIPAAVHIPFGEFEVEIGN